MPGRGGEGLGTGSRVRDSPAAGLLGFGLEPLPSDCCPDPSPSAVISAGGPSGPPTESFWLEQKTMEQVWLLQPVS